MFNYEKLTTDLPKSLFVPSSVEQFIASGRIRRPYWFLKFFKRLLIYWVIGRCMGVIAEKQSVVQSKKILWIHHSAPSIGDCLMDLGARVLLADKQVDLLTNEKNASLFAEDNWFRKIFYKPAQVNEKYDVVLCDSYAPRVLLRKMLASPEASIATMYGFLNGFDLNRTYFGFARMLDLLEKENCSWPMRPYLTKTLEIETGADVCIAVTGEWPFRTYQHWHLVIEKLLSYNVKIHLVGGIKDQESHKALIQKFPSLKSSAGNQLCEVASEISNTPFFIGADGGLWHIACAMNRPTVALFADCEIFDSSGHRCMRNTTDMCCEIIYDHQEVSNIHADSVVDAYLRLVSRMENIRSHNGV